MKSKKPAAKKDQPLRCSVEGDELVIRIGIDVLAFAFEEAEENNPFDYESKSGDFHRKYGVIDKGEFANDVARAMNDEAENGDTPLNLFLDRMMQAAVDDGSLGIEEMSEIRALQAAGEIDSEDTGKET